MDTNRHEYRWTSFNDKRHQNASAILCPWGDDVMVMTASWERGRPARTKPGTASQPASPPLGSTGTGATALLRPGRCCSRRQGGCLQHRTEAQRQPKGQYAGGTPALPGDKEQNAGGTPALPGDKAQDAGGTPALPGDAVPAVRWGVSGGRLLGKPTCALWETPVCPQNKGSWGGNARLPLPTRLNGVGSIPFQWLAIGLRPRLNAGVAFAAYWNPGLAPGDFLLKSCPPQCQDFLGEQRRALDQTPPTRPPFGRGSPITRRAADPRWNRTPDP